MKLLSFFIMVVLVFLSRAQAQSHLVITSAVDSGQEVRVFYTLSNWSTNDAALSPCSGFVRVNCFVFPALYTNGALVSGQPGLWVFDVVDRNPLTLGRVLVTVMYVHNISIPYSGSVLVPKVRMNDSSCLAFINTLGLNNVADAPPPFSNCARIMPAPVRCDISGNTTIDHKTLLDSALNGAQASTKLNVKCNASASVSVRATRTNSYGVSLRNDDSLYSVVTVNNRDSTNGIDMSVTGNLDSPLNITSTLVTRGAVAPGPFSGSTVITVTPN